MDWSTRIIYFSCVIWGLQRAEVWKSISFIACVMLCVTLVRDTFFTLGSGVFCTVVSDALINDFDNFDQESQLLISKVEL